MKRFYFFFSFLIFSFFFNEMMYGWGNSIYSSIEKGDTGKVIEAIEKGINITVSTYKGDSLLHLAAQGPNPDIVELLIGIGCDVNAQNVNGETPLHVAINYAKRENAIKLLRWGKNVDIYRVTKEGKTPLLLLDENIKYFEEKLRFQSLSVLDRESIQDKVSQLKTIRYLLKILDACFWAVSYFKKN